MNRRSVITCTTAVVLALAIFPATAASPGVSLIKGADLKEWLSYIASDALAGRATYSTGLGLAAAYIEDHLRAWGVKPAGMPGPISRPCACSATRPGAALRSPSRSAARHGRSATVKR